MKSWADHCSSDEESDGGQHQKAVANDAKDEKDDITPLMKEDEEPQDEIPPPLPLANFASNYPQFHEAMQGIQGPPFSVYLGNLPFRIQTNEGLARTIEALVEFRYEGQQQVRITSARLAIDRETKRPKGFANIDFDTVEELIILLNLSDGHCFIEGRQIRMDLSTAPSTKTPKKYPDVDGSQFRGGKFARGQTKGPQPSSVSSTATPESARLNRTKASTSNTNLVRNTSTASGAVETASVEKQRPTLKLMPRSKPADNNEASGAKPATDIFGGAKPRDETLWRSTSGTEKDKTQQPSEPSVEPEKHRDHKDLIQGTKTEDIELKMESTETKNQKWEKKGYSRGSRYVESDRTGISGSTQRSDVHRDDRNKRDHQQGYKEQKTVKHESKTKDSSNRASRKVKVNADGWEEAPSIQKIHSGLTANPAYDERPKAKAEVELKKTDPSRKLSNKFEALNMDNSDSDSD